MSRPPFRATATVLAAAAVVVAALLLPAGVATAHSGLVRVTPADGSTVGTAPTQVRLVFDEDVRTPASVVVAGPDGQRVQRGTPRIHDAAVTVDVAVTAPGRYTIGFRVVSADGHPVTGQTTFRYEPGASATTLAQDNEGHEGSGGHAASAGGSGGISGGRALGIIAVAALLAGLALLTVRRLPGGAVHPDRDGGP